MNKNIKIFLYLLIILTILSLIMTYYAVSKDNYGEGVLLFNENTLPLTWIEEQLPDVRIDYQENVAFIPYHVTPKVQSVFGPHEALIKGKGGYSFTPMYQTTPVIATIRGDKIVHSYKDLLRQEKPVLLYQNGHLNYLIASISHAIGGEEGDFSKGLNYLNFFKERNLIAYDDLEKIHKFDYILLFDYQAAQLKAEGIIKDFHVPEEGGFSYDIGLLIQDGVNFKPCDLPECLVKHNYRLPDGTANKDIYPDASEYDRVEPIKDYAAFSERMQSFLPRFTREFEGNHLYSPVDGIERDLAYRLLIVGMIFWGGYLYTIASNSTVRLGFLLITVENVIWLFLRILKNNTNVLYAVRRILWYGYYLPIILIPLLLLWILWANHNHPTEITVPKRGWYYLAISLTLFMFVMTNDLHFAVFTFPDGFYGSYRYNWGYILIYAWVIFTYLHALYYLFHHAQVTRNYKALIFPLLMIFINLIYNVGYGLRFSLAWNSDFTSTQVTINMLILMSLISTGFIDKNTGYTDFFKNSIPWIMLTDQNLEPLIQSKQAQPLTRLEKNLIFQNPSIKNVEVDHAMLLNANPLRGGFVVWKKDATLYKKLQRSLMDTKETLERNNALLVHEEQQRSYLAELKWRNHVYDEVRKTFAAKEAMIADELAYLKQISNVPLSTEQVKTSIAKINALACFIKRKSNLLLMEQDRGYLKLGDLASALQESLSYAKLLNMQTMLNHRETGALISAEKSFLFYDYFQFILERSYSFKADSIYVRLRQGPHFTTMVMLIAFRQKPNVDVFKDLPENIRLQIENNHGKIKINTEDGYSFTLRIPREGDDHA